MTHAANFKTSPLVGTTGRTSRRIAGAMTGLMLFLSGYAVAPAIASPIHVMGSDVMRSQQLATEVRHRRPIRKYRYGRRSDAAGQAAVLGLFGALVGAAVANRGHHNYSYYSYGSPSDYGYAPYYDRGPGYYDRGFRGGRYRY